MAEHTMNLNPEPYEMIKCGKKTIELRLYDERRRSIVPGDIIKFVHTESKEEIRARVIKLHIFDSFTDLYSSLPLLKCGYTEEDIGSADPADMEIYYPQEKQMLYKVVGIEIQAIT